MEKEMKLFLSAQRFFGCKVVPKEKWLIKSLRTLNIPFQGKAFDYIDSKEIESILSAFINELSGSRKLDQIGYDKRLLSCIQKQKELILNSNDRKKKVKLTFGQVQKITNIYIKHYYCEHVILSKTEPSSNWLKQNEWINNIGRYMHCPIDRKFTLNNLMKENLKKEEKQMVKSNISWSKIDDEAVYIEIIKLLNNIAIRKDCSMIDLEMLYYYETP